MTNRKKTFSEKKVFYTFLLPKKKIIIQTLVSIILRDLALHLDNDRTIIINAI